METFRPQFPVPILCIDNFLSDLDAGKILAECIDLRRIYMPARVFDGVEQTKVDGNFRANEVVYIDSVFSTAPERSDIITIIRKRLWDDDCRALWHEGYHIFDIINYCTAQESVVSRYGEGQFYKKHQDTRWDRVASRLVTLIYYIQRPSANYEGGSLLLWSEDEYTRIEPRHNRAVIFPSFAYHQVEPVTADSSEWEDGRFSVNHWIGFG